MERLERESGLGAVNGPLYNSTRAEYRLPNTYLLKILEKTNLDVARRT